MRFRLRACLAPWFILLLLAGCEDTGLATLGPPTLIPSGTTAVEVLCNIQDEFRALPKPVLREIVWHPEERRWRPVEFQFGHRERIPAYHEFVLTDRARQWTRTHTDAEIITALMPLVFEPEVGAEAATLMTGLATGRRYRSGAYGYHPARVSGALAREMADIGYRSPGEPGSWNADAAARFSLPREVYWAVTDPAVEDPRALNTRLEQLQSAIFYYESRKSLPGMLAPAADLDNWLARNTLPPPPDAEGHARLMNQWGRELVVFASLPLGTRAGIGVYELGLERWWPVAYDRADRIDALADRPAFVAARAEFNREYRVRAVAVTEAACRR